MNGTNATMRSPELLREIDRADRAAEKLLTMAALIGECQGIDEHQTSGLALFLEDVYEDVRGLIGLLEAEPDCSTGVAHL